MQFSFIQGNITKTFGGVAHETDSKKIRACFVDLEHFHEAMPLDESDRLFSLVARLCIEYERAAFTEGIHIGVQLMEELRDL